MTRKTSARDALAARRGEFRRALLAWYHANRRSLPWREEPSVYRTVVSEFMLQQTQVKTVLPYFARWTAALPGFAALAAAPESVVLKLWEGLGYYSRARNLHRLAQAVVLWPSLPQTPEEWRELPGVGPYTAAAICSIALGRAVACVDGNVVRILARLVADGTDFRDSASASKAFTALAGELVDPAEPGDHNQAMMELGATVCLKHKPACLLCPVRRFCAGAASGEPEAYPRLAPKLMEQVKVVRLWCERSGSLLLHRAEAGARRLANLHELPTAEQAGFAAAEVARTPLLAAKKRGITRFQITEFIHRAPPPPQLRPGLVWIPLSDLEAISLSGPHRRWITELLAHRTHSP